MRPSLFASTLLCAGAAFAQAPGYDGYPTCISSTESNSSFSFGQHYAVLNLDLINGLVEPIANTSEAKTWISNLAHWISVVHKQSPPPLSIFTRIYFTNARQPEIGPNAPFRQVSAALGTASDPDTHLYPAFKPNVADGDVILQKTRYYAGAGNGLEEILRTQGIDTVILSGIRTSGVVLSTAYRLFDLDYNV